MSITIRIDPHPDETAFAELWSAAWGTGWTGGLEGVLARSLVHLCAYDGERLIGYVNVAWDGGIHAFLLDPTVHPDFRRRGLGTRLVREAIALARERGAHWMHVDYEPELDHFYRACGFRPTAAGVIELQARR